MILAVAQVFVQCVLLGIIYIIVHVTLPVPLKLLFQGRIVLIVQAIVISAVPQLSARLAARDFIFIMESVITLVLQQPIRALHQLVQTAQVIVIPVALQAYARFVAPPTGYI